MEKNTDAFLKSSSFLQRHPAFLYICIAIIGVALIGSWMHRPGDRRIEQAESAYREGEKATTAADRKQAFNTALNLFLQLDSQYNPHFGTGRLYYDIGNTYTQLEQYPWAILYYLKAQNLMPREEVVQRNLALAQKKIDIMPPPAPNVFQNVLFHSPFSLPEYLQAFSFLILITFLLYSGWIWKKKRWCWNAALVSLTFTGLLLVYLALYNYLSPIHAVLVHAAEMRRDAGITFAKVGDTPIPAGTLVDVISTSSDGSWVKISIPGGSFGYVTLDSLRPVN